MKAICPVCKRKIGVMASGHLRRHVEKLGGDGRICEGSWRRFEDKMIYDLESGENNVNE